MSENHDENVEVIAGSGRVVDGGEVPVSVEPAALNQVDATVLNGGRSVMVGSDTRDIKMAEDGGREDDFVDCPDVIEGPETPRYVEESIDDAQDSPEGLINGTHDGDLPAEVEHLRKMLNDIVAEKDRIAREAEEERAASTRELTIKNQEIDALNLKVSELNTEQENSAHLSGIQLEKEHHMTEIANQIFASLLSAVPQEEEKFSDDSVTGKMYRVQNQFSFLVDALAEFRTREVNLNKHLSFLSDENGKLSEELNKLKMVVANANAEVTKLSAEVEQERTRYANTKEKLSMAVTKGKALVQHRDALKQSLSEKTSELERCKIELQEKSNSLEAAEETKDLLVKSENLAASLRESLVQKDTILRKCEEILSKATGSEQFHSTDTIEKAQWLADEMNALKETSLQLRRVTSSLSSFDFPESVQSNGLDTQVAWLLESFDVSKEEVAKLHEQIGQLTASLVVEAQDTSYLQEELEDLKRKYEVLVQKEHRASTDKNYIISVLLEASKIDKHDQELVYQNQSDMTLLIKKCLGKIKEESSASIESYKNQFEFFEQTQSDLYVRDLEARLYEQLLTEEMSDRAELNRLSSHSVKVTEELCALKEEKESLEKNLEQYEEKVVLLREKLSMAVKKGKGLVQEREKLKGALNEKSGEIEKLKSDLQSQVSVSNDHKTQIDKLEADLVATKDQRDQLEQFLAESNNMLQKVIESLDGIALPADLGFQDPVEKVKWLAEYVIESQNAKVEVEQELVRVKDEVGSLANQLLEDRTAIKSLEDALSAAENNISQLREDKNELATAKAVAEKQLENAIEEASSKITELEKSIEEASSKIAELEQSIEEAFSKNAELDQAIRESSSKNAELEKAIEEASSKNAMLEKAIEEAASKNVELEKVIEEAASKNAELEKAVEEASSKSAELEKMIEEASSKNAELEKAIAEASSGKSDEDVLLMAEKNVLVLKSEKEEALLGKDAAESELQKVKEEFTFHIGKLKAADEAIQSLEDALARAEKDVSLLTEENNRVQVGRADLENEMERLKEEAADASMTIKSLEDALLNSENKVSDLVNERKTAREEILVLNSKLDACMQELVGSRGSIETKLLELSTHVTHLQFILRDDTLFSSLRQTFEKKFDSLQDMDHVLKEIWDSFPEMESDVLPDHPVKDDFSLSTPSVAVNDVLSSEEANGEPTSADSDSIILHLGKTVDGFQRRNKILAENIGHYSALMDVSIAALLRKLQLTKSKALPIIELTDSLEQKVRDAEVGREVRENTIKLLKSDVEVLVSAFTDAANELDLIQSRLSEVGSNFDLENLNGNSPKKLGSFGSSESARAAEKLLVAAKHSRQLTEQFKTATDVVVGTIKDLQVKLEESKNTCVKVSEEKEIQQERISQLETNLEEMNNLCDEMRLKLEDYQAKEDYIKEKEAELLSLSAKASLRYREAEDSALSASQMKSLFDKIHEIETLVGPDVGDAGAYDSPDVRKLFYVIDTFPTLQLEMRSLSREKKELQSSLEKQEVEIEHLKEEVEELVRYEEVNENTKNELLELTIGLENIIKKLGNNNLVALEKKTPVMGLLPVLDKVIVALVSESEILKAEKEEMLVDLHGTRKVVEDLSSKVKSLESSNQLKVTPVEISQDRGIFETASLPAQSEISEVQDVVPVSKNLTSSSVATAASSSVAPAAHVRSLRKGSTDQLAINIDSESERLLDDKEADQEKGHAFKSLNSSGLIPVQGRIIADRIDGVWVSSSRALMNHPRGRLGLIAYCLLLHIWLLGTIL